MEFIEKITPQGLLRAVLVDADLKAAGSHCIVSERPGSDYADGKTRYWRRTSNGSNGSVRYASFTSLDEAYATALAWARRKVRAHQRNQAELKAQAEARAARELAPYTLKWTF